MRYIQQLITIVYLQNDTANINVMSDFGILST
jgi:hypothetical protein